MLDLDELVIAGDSYSLSLNRKLNGGECVSWSYVIEHEWNARVIARGGWSNWDIWKAVKHLPKHTPIILNFSHPTRAPLGCAELKGDSTLHPNSSFQLNQRCMEDCLNWFKHAWFWTPFPGYEHIDSVHTLYFRGENDLWDATIPPHPIGQGIEAWAKWCSQTGYTSSHLTKRGHALMQEKVEKVLTQWTQIV